MNTITLEYYNTTVLKFTPKKENNQISINILKLIYLKYQTYMLAMINVYKSISQFEISPIKLEKNLT